MDNLHSIVVPVYNEQDVIASFYERLTSVLLGRAYEVIFVDDGSADRTPEILDGISLADPHVRVVRLSRNFGHQVAITAGMDYARGETVTSMDSDLQHPPEVVPRMIEAWEQGADIVFAVKQTRHGESVFKRLNAQLYYRLLRAMTDTDIPLDASDFRLTGRRATDGLRAMREHGRYLRGLAGWMGMRRAFVPYESQPRHAGETKYSMRKMTRLALDGVLSFSVKPLRTISALGFVVSGLSFLYGMWAVANHILGGGDIPGWTSLITSMLFLGGIQLFAIGIVGEYVAKILEEVRGRPLYFVVATRGFDVSDVGSDQNARTPDRRP